VIFPGFKLFGDLVMTDKEGYKPLIVVFPHDLSLPIYYSPENDDGTILFTQTLSAMLLGSRDLDYSQIEHGFSILKAFMSKKLDRRILYAGSGAILVLPSRYKQYEKYMFAFRETFKKLGIDLHIKFWDELDGERSIVLFAMDMSLRTDDGIKQFISRLQNQLDIWDEKAKEIVTTGVLVF